MKVVPVDGKWDVAPEIIDKNEFPHCLPRLLEIASVLRGQFDRIPRKNRHAEIRYLDSNLSLSSASVRGRPDHSFCLLNKPVTDAIDVG